MTDIQITLDKEALEWLIEQHPGLLDLVAQHIASSVVSLYVDSQTAGLKSEIRAATDKVHNELLSYKKEMSEAIELWYSKYGPALIADKMPRALEQAVVREVERRFAARLTMDALGKLTVEDI